MTFKFKIQTRTGDPSTFNFSFAESSGTISTVMAMLSYLDGKLSKPFSYTSMTVSGPGYERTVNDQKTLMELREEFAARFFIAEEKAKAEAETAAKVEAETRAKAEAEAKAKVETEAKAKAEAEAKTKAEAEAKAEADRVDEARRAGAAAAASASASTSSTSTASSSSTAGAVPSASTGAGAGVHADQGIPASAPASATQSHLFRRKR